jgi:hypothetical protein
LAWDSPAKAAFRLSWVLVPFRFGIASFLLLGIPASRADAGKVDGIVADGEASDRSGKREPAHLGVVEVEEPAAPIARR